jgi:septal ring-binding cell division protein DamX
MAPRQPVAATHAAPHAPVEPVMPLPRPAAVAPAAPTAPVDVSRPPAPAPQPAGPTAPAAPAAAPSGDGGRSISNWRERRPAPMPIAPPPAGGTPAAEAYAAADAGEDLRAKRTRLIAVAAVVAAVAIGAVVIYSTGLGDLIARRGKPATTSPATTSPATTTDGAASTGAPAVAQPPAASSTPVAAPAAASGPAFGIQVASFRTAGRAARVLNDYVETTGLPGEVLTSAGDADEPWYRIVLGRFATEEEARTQGETLLAKGVIAEAIVIPYTPRVDKPATR